MSICKKHGVEMRVMEALGFGSVEFCPKCDEESFQSLEPARRLEELQRTHLETLHELGALKALMKKMRMNEKKGGAL